MRILLFSDLHGFGTLPETNPDLVILLGDIDYYEIRKIDELYNCKKIGVLGNHDAPDYFEGTSIINAHKQIIQIGNVTFAGFEGCPIYNKRKYLQYTEEEVEEFLNEIGKVDFFISHSNPMINEDYEEDSPHRGFKAFTNYIQNKKPSYFAHGHIHHDNQYEYQNTKILSIYPKLEIDIKK